MSPLLQVTDLAVTFPAGDAPVTAVRGISYRIEPGKSSPWSANRVRGSLFRRWP